MSRLFLTTWAWGTKYGPDYIDKLRGSIARNLTQPYEFRVIETDDPLTKERGCFARLRAFDPYWQAQQGFEPGDRIVCMDLDLIVTGSLNGLFDRKEPFVILTGANSANPCPYNGSLQMLRAGHRPDVWADFSLEAAEKLPRYEFVDDQQWLFHKLPGAGSFGPDQGIFAFHKPGWPKGEALPKGARIVAFPGWRDPVGFQHLDWVAEHWRA